MADATPAPVLSVEYSASMCMRGCRSSAKVVVWRSQLDYGYAALACAGLHAVLVFFTTPDAGLRGERPRERSPATVPPNSRATSATIVRSLPSLEAEPVSSWKRTFRWLSRTST